MRVRHIDIAGQRFGRLLVIERLGRSNDGSAKWNCLCDCGNYHVTTRAAMRKGLTKSCGCLHSETAREMTIKRLTTHGHTAGKISKLYRTWTSMKTRCYVESCNRYHIYGARGISVCKEWRNDFAAFAKYVGDPPSPKHSIDRIDVDGDYAPGNVRWATAKEQANNKRRNKEEI